MIVSTMHTFFFCSACSKMTPQKKIKVMKSFLNMVARVSRNTLFFFRFGIFLYFVFAFLFVVFQVLISFVCFLKNVSFFLLLFIYLFVLILIANFPLKNIAIIYAARRLFCRR